jgi:F-type H+-transporting ATPase subunit a
MKQGPSVLQVSGIPEHVTYAWFGMAVLIGLALLVRSSLKKGAPSGAQNVMEVIFEGLNNYVEEIMGPHGKPFFSLIGSLFLFILVGNLMGLVPGFNSPTSNINMTLALALCVFAATHIIGIAKHGFSYFKHFMGPVPWLAPLMIPIEVISHVARPVSLSFRLFGNMVAKHELMLVLAMLAPFFAPVPILGLGLFVAFVQAGVFTLLTMLYLAGSIEEGHGDEHH